MIKTQFLKSQFNCWIALFVVFATPSQADDRESAKEKFQEGIELFASEKYSAALAKFTESYEAYPRYSTLFNIANCNKALLNNEEAILNFHKFLEGPEEEIDPSMRQEAREAVDELLARVGLLKIDGAEEGATVCVNGKEVAQTPLAESLILNPGAYGVRVTYEGYEPFETEIQIVAGAENLIWAKMKLKGADEESDFLITEVTPDKESKTNPQLMETVDKKTSPLKITGFVASGLGVVGIGVGIAFTSMYFSHQADGNRAADKYGETGDEQYRQDYLDADEKLKVDVKAVTIGYVVGGTLFAAGIIMIVVDRYKNRKEKQLSWVVNPDGMKVLFW